MFSFKENVLYLSQIPGQHIGIFPLFFQDLPQYTSLIDKVALGGIYIGNLLGIILLLDIL